jgi:tRNA(Ile)-lysidine synthase
MKLLEKVKQTINKHSLLSKGDRVVVGLSGGPDSMSLLDILSVLREEYDLVLIPAHLNHGFRGREAEEDLAFCEEVAGRYGFDLVSESVDLPALIREEGLSPQAAAREVRYDFFVRTAAANSASKIALGHHADDQAETQLMRLLRGAGTRGLAGIPIQREPGIIRPLLHVAREEILLYLKERKISYRNDSSNQKEIYLRNRIRKELIPLLKEKYNPNLVEDLLRTAEILGEEEAFLAEQAESCFSPVRTQGGLALEMSDLKKLPRALLRRVIRLAIAHARGSIPAVTFQHVCSVIQLMQAEGSSARIDLPGGMTVRKVYERLEFCSEVVEELSMELHEIPIPGRETIPVLEIEVESSILSPEEVPPFLHKGTALFDFDKCSPPLSIRTRVPGDVFFPKGFGRRKKVKRFFIDEKIPHNMRNSVPLLVNRENEILWVGGYRMDNRFSVDHGTSRALFVQIHPVCGRMS